MRSFPFVTYLSSPNFHAHAGDETVSLPRAAPSREKHPERKGGWESIPYAIIRAPLDRTRSNARDPGPARFAHPTLLPRAKKTCGATRAGRGHHVPGKNKFPLDRGRRAWYTLYKIQAEPSRALFPRGPGPGTRVDSYRDQLPRRMRCLSSRNGSLLSRRKSTPGIAARGPRSLGRGIAAQDRRIQHDPMRRQGCIR